jgi:hypothetical protein
MSYNRKSANSRRDKKGFSRNAMRTHKRNMFSKPMRGGIRL